MVPRCASISTNFCCCSLACSRQNEPCTCCMYTTRPMITTLNTTMPKKHMYTLHNMSRLTSKIHLLFCYQYVVSTRLFLFYSCLPKGRLLIFHFPVFCCAVPD